MLVARWKPKVPSNEPSSEPPKASHPRGAPTASLAVVGLSQGKFHLEARVGGEVALQQRCGEGANGGYGKK